MSTHSRRGALLVLLALASVDPRDARTAPVCAPTLSGANVAGGEFNGGKEPAVYARDYIYPAAGEIALLKKLGLKMMRVPFLWERIQPQALGPLNPDELTRLDAIVNQTAAAGMTVVLDVHNYGTYRGISLDRSAALKNALPDLWKRLAEHYGGDTNVVFGLMNEPKDIDVENWAAIAKATLAAIRLTAAPNVVLVPGTHWDGAHSWLAAGAGTRSNADALLPLARGDANVVFEVHQYFDDNYSGTAPTCGAAASVPPVLAQVSQWARTHRVRLMLGEFGVSQRPECVKALDDALAVIEHNRDAWYGWTYWSAGAWWGDYPFNLQATNGETPQGNVLRARARALDEPACEASR